MNMTTEPREPFERLGLGSMSFVIRYYGHAIPNPADSTPHGAYLRSFDPEERNGRGLVSWTTVASEAQQFLSVADAYELYNAVPFTRPLRPDGKPNKPLTAYNVMIEPF